MTEYRKTTMGHINQVQLKQITIALAQNNAIEKELEKRIWPISDTIVSNNREIMLFTKQRDELLPLLMNGQASVNYHLSKWSIGFLCLEMHIEYDKNIIQKEADKQEFQPLVRHPYSFDFFKHTSYPFLVFFLLLKMFVTIS